MGWLLLGLLLLAVLGAGDRDGYIIRYVSARDLARRDRADAIPALAILFLAVTWAVVVFAPAWVWGLTWQGAALWFGLAHWYQVTVTWYSTLAIVAVLVLAAAMFAVLERRNGG